MRKSMRLYRVVSALAVASIIVTSGPAIDVSASTDMTFDDFEEIISTYSIDDSILGYNDYVLEHPANYPTSEIEVGVDALSRYEEAEGVVAPTVYDNYNGRAGKSVYTSEESITEFDFTVSQAGFYNVKFDYYPVEGKESSIQRAIFIDGELPYEELARIDFKRTWTNDVSEIITDENGIEVKAWEMDNQGNQVKPEAIEAPEWMSTFLYDYKGYISAPLAIYLEAGAHTISLESQREPMVIGGITFCSAEKTVDYETYKNKWDGAGASDTSEQIIRVEAENALKTSSQMLYPRQDQSSPTVYPESPKVLLNNTIGGDSWGRAGQWIEWEVDVPESGYYNISTYCKQNFVRGVDSNRKIYIDGEVPFTEFEAYGFGYNQNWKLETLSDDNGQAYDIYLAAGKHTIRMEVVLGEMADIIAKVQDCVSDLNKIYRQVIYITGVSPDEFRDYQIESSLPGLEAELVEVQNNLGEAIEELKVTAGNNSDKLTTLRTMYDQLDELIYNQEKFSEILSSFKTNVRACGNWITQVLGQPLQFDRLYVHSADTDVKIDNAGFGWAALYEIQRLFYSFIIDYNQIGNVVDESETEVITVWVGTGRDQANVVKALIDENFTSKTGISVNVQLVDMNTLLRATLAGEGPDVAIQVANTNGIAGAVLNTGNDTPVNYGLRNAVLDLTQFDDYEEISKRFSESAIVPFSFDGKTYALPDTQSFLMMFYRKDILAEIGLEVPETWDEVKVAMTVLAKNQMEFGMLPTEQIFAMLLYQNGGEYYTPNGDRSMLDSDIAVSTFKDYCEFYTDYRLDKATSVQERFRTGECPIIIDDYTTYNNLQVSAPDIAGLWDFTVVPGVKMPDGTINHVTGATGLCDIIMSGTEYPEESWEFLKWWTSAETQTLYGREMESLMGASARVATANLEALGNLAWPVQDYKQIMEQFKQVKGIPQVPGGYYSWRNVNNAFYAVTTDAGSTGRDQVATPREELMDKVLYINAEIDYKREEFGLPLAEKNKKGEE